MRSFLQVTDTADDCGVEGEQVLVSRARHSNCSGSGADNLLSTDFTTLREAVQTQIELARLALVSSLHGFATCVTATVEEASVEHEHMLGMQHTRKRRHSLAGVAQIESTLDALIRRVDMLAT